MVVLAVTFACEISTQKSKGNIFNPIFALLFNEAVTYTSRQFIQARLIFKISI